MPLFGEHPVEMGMAGWDQEPLAAPRAELRYAAMVTAANPQAAEAVSLATLTRALASFVRAVVSADSPYDRDRYGRLSSAIPDAAKHGERLCFSERLECFHCHGGSLADIDAAIDHYARGGRHSPLQSQFVRGFELTPAEPDDFKAFLGSLTDPEFLADCRFADPAAAR